MDSKEAIFLFREGPDDYTLWFVELQEDDMANLQADNGTIRGSFNGLMSQLPMVTEKTATRLHLLSHNGKEFVLHSKDVPSAIMNQYLDEGCSVRGSRAVIRAEITEYFSYEQEHAPIQQLS